LVPPSLNDLSLKDAIEELFQILKLSGTAIECHIKINEDVLEKGLRLNIYRIVQEQFNNIVKYAEAKKVKVTMIQKGDLLLLEIYDNGKGFDMKEKHKGIGLTNIIHRAETYNGKVKIESSHGNGCNIYIEFML
jgi:signal transduction histidine kinase